jgi:protein TonB
MRKFLFILVLLFPGLVQAQPKADTFKCFLEPVPQFPGGEDSLKRYLAKNIVYPESARDNAIEGKVVIRFRVGLDGIADSFRIVKSLSTECDYQVLRAFKQMPKWIPAKDQKHAIWWSYPMFFRME